jgi:hypothetical protein
MTYVIERDVRVSGSRETVKVRIDRTHLWYFVIWTWVVDQCNGYVKRKTSRREGGRVVGYSVYLHREIMGLGSGDVREVDHLNADRHDNRLCNLQIVTKRENIRRMNEGYNDRIRRMERRVRDT